MCVFVAPSFRLRDPIHDPQADVAIEMGFDEALDIIEGNILDNEQHLGRLEEDLAYLKEQIVTMEVSILFHNEWAGRFLRPLLLVPCPSLVLFSFVGSDTSPSPSQCAGAAHCALDSFTLPPSVVQLSLVPTTTVWPSNAKRMASDVVHEPTFSLAEQQASLAQDAVKVHPHRLCCEPHALRWNSTTTPHASLSENQKEPILPPHVSCSGSAAAVGHFSKQWFPVACGLQLHTHLL